MPNPWPYLGHPKAPPPPRYWAPYGDEVPFKAPPSHLARLPGIAVRRDLVAIKAPLAHVFNAPEQLLDLVVIKAPLAQVFNVPEHLLKARAPHVIAAPALELPRPKNTAVAVVGGGQLLSSLPRRQRVLQR